MDNQHRSISGYRELSQVEIDLMNTIKGLGPLIEQVELQVKAHLDAQSNQALNDTNGISTMRRIQDATPDRFVALAKTQFQTGLMYLTRAVAQPTFY